MLSLMYRKNQIINHLKLMIMRTERGQEILNALKERRFEIKAERFDETIYSDTDCIRWGEMGEKNGETVFYLYCWHIDTLVLTENEAEALICDDMAYLGDCDPCKESEILTTIELKDF